MTDDLISQETMLDTGVCIRTAVTQKRPVASHLLDPRQIDLGEHERLVLGGFGDHDPERVADERVAPEFDPPLLPPSRARTAELLEADAVHRGDPAAVRDRVAALDRLPRIELLLAVLLFLRG